MQIFLNGKFVNSRDAKVSLYDHGLLYGDGVFEGIRSYNRRVFRFEEHLGRLYRSAEAIRLKMPLTKNLFRKRIIETLVINNLDNAYIRAVVTRGVGDLGLDPRKCKTSTVFVIADKIVLYPKKFYEKGLSIVIAKTRRNHPTALNPMIKSLNYLNNILGKIDAIDGGVEEALMLSVDGYVAECTGENIVLVKDGKLITPPCSVGLLEGITLKAVGDLASKRGIKMERKEILPRDIYEASECFLTGTAAEIMPVVKVEGKVIGSGKPGKITKELREDFGILTKREGVEY